MSRFQCNLSHCKFETSDLKTYIFHHQNHPNDRNKFVCNQENCHKDLGNSKSYRAHMQKHFEASTTSEGKNVLIYLLLYVTTNIR